MLSVIFIGIICIERISGSFLQCSPSDSLESVSDLESADHAHKTGVICEDWPFYSGGFPKHSSGSSSSSSEESSDDDDNDNTPSLLGDVSSDSILYGFDDEVETHQCLDTTNTGYCSKWVTTKREYQDNKKGCGGHGHDDDEEATLLTEYQICLCADDNYGEQDNININVILSTESPLSGQYCSSWACLETATYPYDYDAYSLVVDNDFVISSSSSSSSSEESSEDNDDDDEYNGNYYRFAKDGQVLDLDESMEFMNCWCKSSSLSGKYCLNWYCESLEHDEYGCHKEGFGVNDYGWFGCYDNSENIETTKCQQFYGFLIDDEDRDEYRCECVDESCLEWICGIKEIGLRRNYMWYNFPLAMILWVCLCGCCGTKLCFKKKFDKCFKCLKCRKCRMFLFWILFSTISLMHGGIPAFLFFNIFASCSLYCSYKCENCKCCQSYFDQKWQCNTSKCQMTKTTIDAAMDTKIPTTRNGEDSKEKEEEESVSKPEIVTKSGHVRVNSVDIDDIDGAQV